MQNPAVNGLRTYSISGKIYYSVTTILSVSKSDRDARMLQAWKDRVGESEAREIGKAATTRGTALHKWCEDYCNGLEPIFDEPTALPFWKGMQPALDRITDVKYQEIQVYHPSYSYAGTLDCYGTFDSVPNTLIDFKTASKSKRFDWIEDYCIQTVAYAAGVRHVYGHNTNQAAIIIALANKPAQVFVLNREEMVYYWELWLKRLAVFHERIKNLT
jgi:hypothetical protein